MNFVNSYFRNCLYRDIREVITQKHLFYRYPWMECVDGFSVSVQGGKGNYCEPREDFAEEYISVELGFPSEHEPLLDEYQEGERTDPTDTVYGWVPVELVEEIIEKHGGLK